MAVRRDLIRQVLDILEGVARSRATISYKRLSDRAPGLPVRGRLMSETLVAVSELSWAARGVLLPVLVVNSGGARLPSEGFYESLAYYRPEEAAPDKTVAARRERERVYRAYPRADSTSG